MDKNGLYQTTILRALAALIGGAVVGGSLSMSLIIILFGPPAPSEYVEIWLMISAYWMAGLWIFAVIPWAVFYYLSLRQWYVMTGQGGATMVVVSLFLFKGIGDINGLAVLGLVGAIVGWIIWRIAYRRVPVKGEEE